MALEFNKVVAVIDVDDNLGELVFETARALVAGSGELHAIDTNPFLTTFESPYAGGALEADAKAHKADGERRMAKLKALAEAGGGATKLAVLEGNPSRDAASYAKKNNADLIVIGSRQKNWWKRLLEGSESSDMIREAPCAVFVVTSAHKKRRDNA